MDNPNKVELHAFQAEFEFVVRDGLIVHTEVIFNETFDNELHVAFANAQPVCVRNLEEGIWLDPSHLEFSETGDVKFSLLFTDHSAGDGRHQTDFVELIWQLANLGFHPDVARSRNPDFATVVGVAMKELAEIDCSSEIEILRYFGLFF